jgi:hypothetical protein
MNDPFVANDGSDGYYGSGMLSLWGGSDKLGPYDNANARHQFMQSQFHRSGDMCGSCHDVSNSAVGDLAPNNGTQPGAPGVISSGILGAPLGDKAAFNNPPYAYGIVERTFSEWKSGALDDMNVMNFPNLPPDLQVTSGALNMAYQSAMLAGGTYEDGTPRNFTCQGCHMRADIGEGCNKKGVLTRSDLPKHDLTGGNYWVWPLIRYQNQQGTLRLGGDLTATQLAAIDAGQVRGEDQLRMAASLRVDEVADTVTITNLTGHKLITGYPEGRRMWLNIKWYDSNNTLLREDGAYGGLGATFTNPVDGTQFEPKSILDLHAPNTKIYEVHPAITQDWANVLVSALPHANTPIGFNRLTGEVEGTLGELAAGSLGPYAKSFHFVLNNHIAEDNRIPPYGMDYETARIRNALPVPDTQYGDPNAVGTGGTFEYWDTVQLNPPVGPTGEVIATSADITLYYQGTSWEYVQFLYLANKLPSGSFLADEGKYFLDAWINTGMVPPFAMATATWGQAACTPTEIDTELTCNDTLDNDCDGFIDGEDTDCQCIPAQEICDDGIDNDCDGFTDGSDTDCQAGDCTAYLDKGTCNNDPNCEWTGSPKNGSCGDAPVCQPTAPDESGLCNDGVDNDCDGLSDCADTGDCGTAPICQATDCSVYTTRNLCNAQPICSWDNKNKLCTNL